MRVPRATYRIQFNRTFDFKAARKVIPYLAELGISDVYASPIFRAKKGSMHGYDVVEPNELNPELGSADDFEELASEIRNHGMGWLQDIVPNHMAFDSENSMLMDVFENAAHSHFFDFFDIYWDEDREAKLEVLAPFLEKFYGEALEEGRISLQFGPEGLSAKYCDFEFPLKIESYARFFTHRLAHLRNKLGDSHSDFIRYLGALYILQALSSRESDTEHLERVKVIKKTFWDLFNENSTIRTFIGANLEEFNGSTGRPDSFNLLDDLLSEQTFRLSFWKVAYEEINYRRFFSINNLISMNVTHDHVFDHLHALIFRLVSEGKFSGLRVDHIDGLYDPAGYLRRLKNRTGDVYTVVEKILDAEESLPRDWQVQGTTGYDFLNHVNGLFCQTGNEKNIQKAYTSFTARHSSYNDLVYEKKRLIIEKHMGGDIDNLARLLKKISGRDRHGRDITLYGLRRALVEILAQFPVYRTYVNNELLSEQDRGYIVEAARRAVGHNPALLNEINYLKKFFLLDFGPNVSDEEKRQRILFVMRFQQYTGPLMAKGFEDTLLYVYNRLISLNEVGGSPNRFGISVEDFHRFNTTRASLWPHTLNATSTHDTKRGEDVRARINVISETGKEWETALKNWNRLNRRKKPVSTGVAVPDRNDEYFFYQTLLGTFPALDEDYPGYIDRIKEYSIKVVREAKAHTAWLKPDEDYENAFLSFIAKAITSRDGNAFLDDFLVFQRKIAYFGIFNSLSQTLLKMTAPGIPDIYQGAELWDLSLVDPDNRRPVDFPLRMRILANLRKRMQEDLPGLLRELLNTKHDGRIKMFLTHRLLLARRELHQLFRDGSYVPLNVDGQHQENIVAFARVHEKTWAVTIAPRFFASIIADGEDPLGEKVWRDTRIVLLEGAPKRWKNTITNEALTIEDAVPVGKVLELFPAALLLSEDDA